MAQSRATTPTVIYNTLTADATFMSYIGTYTFSDNSTASSILITTPGAELPQISSQSGLEVLIQDMANMDTRKYLNGGSDAIWTWPLFFVLWAPDTGDTIYQALERLVQIFPSAESIDTVSKGTILGATAQTQVLITSDCPILTP